jgi:hypothetical protein
LLIAAGSETSNQCISVNPTLDHRIDEDQRLS